MQTRGSSYNDYTIRFPEGIDTTPMVSLRGVAKGAVADNVSHEKMKRMMMEDKYGDITKICVEKCLTRKTYASFLGKKLK